MLKRRPLLRSTPAPPKQSVTNNDPLETKLMNEVHEFKKSEKDRLAKKGSNHPVPDNYKDVDQSNLCYLCDRTQRLEVAAADREPDCSKYDERRVEMLKAQNIQLERHVLALNDILARRHRCWTEIRTELDASRLLMDKFETNSSNQHEITELKKKMQNMQNSMLANIDSRIDAENRELEAGEQYAIKHINFYQLEAELYGLFKRLCRENSKDKELASLVGKILNQLLEVCVAFPPPSSRGTRRKMSEKGHTPLNECITNLRQILRGGNASSRGHNNPMNRDIFLELEKLETMADLLWKSRYIIAYC